MPAKSRTLLTLFTVPVIVAFAGRGVAGVKVTTAPLAARVPPSWAPEGNVNAMVFRLTEIGLTGLLKVIDTGPLFATPADPSAGAVEITVGWSGDREPRWNRSGSGW